MEQVESENIVPGSRCFLLGDLSCLNDAAEQLPRDGEPGHLGC
ncbi:MAG: hypothetical protein ACLT4C_06435 [Butyricicoccus sp.]